MNRLLDIFSLVMPVFIVLIVLLIGISLGVENDTGYPARCAWERMWHGENEWVQTHHCGARQEKP